MKLKIFLSSRNNDKVVIDKTPCITLTEVRKKLKKDLEAIRFLGKEIFDVRINEDFGSDTSTDSYNTCLLEVQESDLVIILYNGVSGWAPVGTDLGICHAEMDTALAVSTKKTAIIDLTSYFTISPGDASEAKRNEYFSKYVKDLNLFMNPVKLTKAKKNQVGFQETLLEVVENVIAKHMNERIKLSNIYFNIAGNNKISLDWKKLKYSDRDKNITGILNKEISKNTTFSIFTYKVYSIPDNMSVEDAKSYTGRPFLKDQELIDHPIGDAPIKYGPIHFIAVYGNASEIQVKNLIGFPDISAIKEDFGIYVWEQNTHVQLVFLTECRTPEAVKSKFLLFNN